MRLLFWAVAVAALLWAGYWVIAARSAEHMVRDWFSAQGSRLAEHDGISVRGFPYRFDLRVRSPRITLTGADAEWRAPEILATALAYRPHHLIIEAPTSQTLRAAGDEIAVTNASMRASMVVRPAPAPDLRSATLVARQLRLDAARGWTARSESIRIAARRLEGDAPRYRLGAEVTLLRPPAVATDLPGGLEPPPEAIDLLRLDGVVSLRARAGGGGAGPRPDMLTLSEFLVEWGDMRLEASGELSFDQSGRPTGRLTLRADGWPRMLAVARGLGLLDAARAEPLARALRAADDMAPGDDTVTLPLRLEDGFVRIGAVPLGPAPRLP